MGKEAVVACGQPLSQEDMEISDSIVELLETKESAIEIISNNTAYLKIYSNTKQVLSDIIPIVHSFNIRVIEEVSYEVKKAEKLYFVMKLTIEVGDFAKLEAHKQNVIELFSAVLNNEISIIRNKLFELTYLENFCKRCILLFIAITKFEEQLVSVFNEPVLIKTLVKYSAISRLYLDYFINKFGIDEYRRVEEFEEKIENELKEVHDLTEDKILRLFYEIIRNIKRTNYFFNKEAIALKIYTNAIRYNLKGINPKIEGFVFHPEFVGTHLRMDKVSRGGLRWSNRPDDYREEIKSLMIAQDSKNAVIIPKGAKGGFVIFKEQVSKEEFQHCYETFVDALLDLVDNKVDDKIIRDERIVAYDDDDFYFVVAADKGTADMSDVANAISLKRDFWLKDAFASGGSHGYHHKVLGVTAKGSMKSSHRFFIEKGVDFYTESITMVGVGSMNGDVFGNGLIESDKFLLKAAISHKEIFIDPNPDAKVSYEERKRLYHERNSAWSAYDASKISKGGGIFRRDEKAIMLSPEIKEAFHIRENVLDSEQLIRYILKAKVDMIYLGGIGTYYKSSSESNIDIGDKANENVRVDARQIRASVVCEGANLGMTMQGRIEFAKKGGKVNLDSIDNSAGVNTSDHEVNIKILLNMLVEKGFINEEERNENLKNLTDFVVNSVLQTNYFQSLALSLDEIRSQHHLHDFIQTIEVLENNVEHFKREDFFIPKNNEIDKILTSEGKIVRPILAVIMLYTKIHMQNLLLKDPMIDDLIYNKYLFKYFPKNFVAVYKNEIVHHPLKKEIVAMVICNTIVNHCGATFIANLDEIGVDAFILKIKAYMLSNKFFGANDLRYEIYRNDFLIPVQDSYSFLMELEKSILFSAGTMLNKLEVSEMNFDNVILLREKTFNAMNTLGFDLTFDFEHCNKKKFYESLHYLKLITYILEIKKNTQLDFEHIAILYYKLIKDLNIVELLKRVEEVDIDSEVQYILKQQLLKMIESVIVDLPKKLIEFRRKDEDIDMTLGSFFKEREKEYSYYHTLLSELDEDATAVELSIIVNQLLLLK